jgi:hypothetical protein
MNITSVEVSTPFFHENNTAAMNTYEAPVQSGLAETASLVEPEKSKSIQWCPCEAAKSEAAQSETSPVQSEAGQSEAVQSEASPLQSGEENTLAYVMQTSINHAVRMKEYYEECACGYRCFATYGSIMCGAIWNNAEKEYEKLEKSKEIMMQHIRPMAMDSQSSHAQSNYFETAGPMGEGGVGAQSAPIPWRWENRTAALLEGGVWGRAAFGGGASPQERGKCLLYRPVAYMHAFNEHNFDYRTVDRYNFDPNTFNQHVIDQHMSRQTPVCLLRENDVVDNGTVMCLRAFKTECFYGNETMKAMLEMEKLYRPEIPAFKFPEIPKIPEMSQTTCIILFIISILIVGALQKARCL